MNIKIFIVSFFFIIFSCNTGDTSEKQAFLHKEKGRELVFQKKYNEAIAEFNKAIEKNNQYDTAYINLGMVYILLGEYNEAIDVLQKAIEINPDEPNRYAILSSAFLNLKEYDKAKELLNKAKFLSEERNEESEIVYSTFALYYMNTEDYGRALYNLTRVAELNPLNSGNFAQRALLYYYNEEYENALKDIHKAIGIDSTNQEYLNLQLMITQEINNKL